MTPGKLTLLVGLLVSAPAAADLHYGLTLFHSGEPAAAIEHLRPLAEDGDASAGYHLYRIYHDGRGVDVDEEQALVWLRQASENGDPRAQYHWGRHVLHAEPADVETGVTWLTRAAEQGYARAAAQMGAYYASGSRLSADPEKAMHWSRYAAERGDSWAMMTMGSLYDNAIGVPADVEQAAHWYTEAANHGSKRAAQRLADMCAQGRGVSRDMDQAHFWCAVASNRREGRRGLCAKLAQNMSEQEIDAYNQRAYRWDPLAHPYRERRTEEVAKAMLKAIGAQSVRCLQGGLLCALYPRGAKHFEREWDRRFRDLQFEGILEPQFDWTDAGDRRMRSATVDGNSLQVFFDPASRLVELGYRSAADRERKAFIEGIEHEPDTPARLLQASKVQPRIPRGRRGRGIPGKVVLTARIEADGTVSRMQLSQVEPLGQGHDDAAIEAVRQWRYAPATKNGEPVAVLFPVFLEFLVHQ